MAEDSLESCVICAEDLGGLRPPDPLPVIYVSLSERLGEKKRLSLFYFIFFYRKYSKTLTTEKEKKKLIE